MWIVLLNSIKSRACKLRVSKGGCLLHANRDGEANEKIFKRDLSFFLPLVLLPMTRKRLSFAVYGSIVILRTIV